MKLYAVRKRIRSVYSQGKVIHKHYDFSDKTWFYTFDKLSITSNLYEAKEVLKDNPDAEVYELTLKLS